MEVSGKFDIPEEYVNDWILGNYRIDEVVVRNIKSGKMKKFLDLTTTKTKHIKQKVILVTTTVIATITIEKIIKLIKNKKKNNIDLTDSRKRIKDELNEENKGLIDNKESINFNDTKIVLLENYLSNKDNIQVQERGIK